MRGVVFRFKTFERLAETLDCEKVGRDVGLPSCHGLRDGDWLLATFEVGDESTAIAGRVVDRGDCIRLSFEDRDWRKLCDFANLGGPPSSRPEDLQSLSEAVPPPGSKVLVIDDDGSVQAIVLAMLQAAGYLAEACNSAEEALDRLREQTVDLIILDRNLNGMNGIELCRRLRRDARHGSLPILFLSALTSDTELREAFEAGADDFVGKPFRARELGARVLGLICRSKAARVDA